jgi:hypothetical protein
MTSTGEPGSGCFSGGPTSWSATSVQALTPAIRSLRFALA